jgi:hypothetical protein
MLNMTEEEKCKIHIGKELLNVSSMVKTLVYVPRMITREQFRGLVGEVPDDFDRTVKEFWEYIQERLKAVSSRIRWVYSYSFSKDDGQALIQEEESAIIKELVKNGAQLQTVTDPILAAEVKAWFEMTKTSSSQVVFELYEESLNEMCRRVTESIDQTLQSGDMGVLFIDSSLNLSFPMDLKVIRMFPFDPQDYLKRHQVKLRK